MHAPAALRCLSLALLLVVAAAPRALSAAETWQSLHDAAEQDHRAGQFDQAAEKLKKALVLAEAEGDPQAISDVNYALGAVYLEQRKLEEARTHLKASLAHEEKVAGPNAQTTLEALESLAIADDYDGKFADAEVHFRSLLGRWKELEQPPGAAVARALTNLALNLEYQKRDDEAEPLYREGLAIYHQLKDPEQEAFIRNGLGNLCQRRKDRKCARREYGLALSLREQTLGRDHPYVATVLFNLSGIELDENRPAKAKALLTRCLKIRRATLPADHPFLVEAEARMQETQALLKKSKKGKKGR
ncbi:MAG: tetratricopeptide repeat protein [Deltaproteobacteria bacterium]|nr:tetratricopeptide repeat protein [Deltaproteobacteria bacterium]